MIRDPAPAVVAMAMVRPPSLRCAYGKYMIGRPLIMTNSPAQNGRVPRQARNCCLRWANWPGAAGLSALMENSSLVRRCS